MKTAKNFDGLIPECASYCSIDYVVQLEMINRLSTHFRISKVGAGTDCSAKSLTD